MSLVTSNKNFSLPILVSQESNRQNYIFDLIFNQLLGINYHYVDSSFSGKVLSYGMKNQAFYQESHDFMHDSGIKKLDLEYANYKDKEFPFRINETNSLFEFDLFAVCFYCVSRYEEYLNTDLDEHGRFKPQNSWLYKKDLLKIPVVNFLAHELKEKINSHFSVSLPDTKQYEIKPSIDIDNAYAFYNRLNGIWRSQLKSLLKFDFDSFKLKSRAKNDKTQDPFNTHDKIISFLSTFHPKVFFLIKSGGKDSTNDVGNKEQYDLIKQYENAGFIIGLHPSYEVVSETSFKQEFTQLKSFFPKLNSSRYHFIKNVLPHSYSYLTKMGIEHEHSMGYATQTGFRAAICHSFYWYDLLNEESTKLLIHPFYFMDATYVFNLNLTPRASIQDVEQITSEVKKYNGHNSFVFHNESLSDVGVYEGWGEFLENVLEVVK